MALAAASRYARALADLVLAPARGSDPEAVAVELAVFEQALAGSTELRNVLLSPAVKPALKRAVVARLAGDAGLSRLVTNFLYVLIDHRRTAMLSEIRQAFRGIVDERLGAVEVEVAAARELTDEQHGQIALRLGRLTGKKVRCRFAADSSLIGGMVARIGSTIYDGSVRGQLEALRRRLTD
jgi:F-type H+-transporting ATPase subunit delta